MLVYIIVAIVVGMNTQSFKKGILWIFYLQDEIVVENEIIEDENDFPDFFDHH